MRSVNPPGLQRLVPVGATNLADELLEPPSPCRLSVGSVEELLAVVARSGDSPREGHRRGGWDRIRSREVDVGFVTLPAEELETVPVAEDEVLAVLPEGHRWQVRARRVSKSSRRSCS